MILALRNAEIGVHFLNVHIQADQRFGFLRKSYGLVRSSLMSLTVLVDILVSDNGILSIN